MSQEVDQLDKIAVIGMAGRFPDAPSIDKFGQNLCAGIESVTTFTDQQLLAAGVPPKLIQSPNYVKTGVLLEGVDLFDAGFFGYTPREAQLTDPQHRMFLEIAWEALEDAGYDPDRGRLRVGVFAGAGSNSYLQNNLVSNPDLISSLHYLQRLIATENDYLSTRVSYKLNLKGPSLTIQTACSSSLVAIHIACQSLLHGECDMALAGGISLRIPQIAGYLYEQGSTVSSDGRCRAFDASAQGMMPGSGAAVIVLKRLADAMEDGDFIRAVIRGSAVNNDGAAKAGYTAPSIEGQTIVVAAAQALAGVSADDISYIEAMGTGTALGDSIEIAALTKAFRRTSRRRGFCAIGSVKTNIGHLGAASGVAGLVKVVLAIQNRVLPPSLNFNEPNPAINFADGPFYVQQELQPWKPANGRCVAGVSSFGVGGTNAHVIVEEAPAAPASDQSPRWQILPISARTPAALEQATDRLAEFLASHPDLNLADVAFTLQQGRKAFAYRRVLAAKSVDEAAALLKARDGERVFTDFQQPSGSPVAFMFPGPNALCVNIGLETYHTEKTFREHVDFCSEFLKPHLGFNLRQVLFPAIEAIPDAVAQLKRTAIAQTATFVIEYALARLWMSWGASPEVMIGDGIGEFVAACLAGVFSLSDALTLLAGRARLLESLPVGIESAVRDLLRGVTLNAPTIPCIANVTGTWITPSEAKDPAYWANHLTHTVPVAEGLNELIKAPHRILLEVGPGQMLDSQSRHLARACGHAVFSSFGYRGDGTQEAASMLTALGQLWTKGVRPDWRALYDGERRRRVSLPTYPFERQRYWIDAKNPGAQVRRDDTSSESADLKETLAAVWREVLGFESIGDDDNFFDLGGDSFTATLLLSRLRARIPLELPANSIFVAPTIAAQLKLMAKVARGEHEIILPIQKGDASRPPLFLIHSYHLYASLPRALGSSQSVYGVEEFAVSDPVDNWTLENMMSRYVDGIRSVEPHGPYFIGGFCSAAMPAFEVARQLEEAGESVPLLLIIDPMGKASHRQVQPGDLERLPSKIEFAGAFCRFHIGKLRSMPAVGMLGYLANLGVSKLRNFLTNVEIRVWRRIIRLYIRCGAKIPSVLRRKLISGIRVVTLEAIRGYSPKPYKGDIAVFLATDTNLGLSVDVSPWRNATSGDVQVIWLPGDHATAFVEPNLTSFAQELSKALDGSIGDGSQSHAAEQVLTASAV
jgi:acyl transferase domain-containing protein/thioesterase domain-containing protein